MTGWPTAMFSVRTVVATAGVAGVLVVLGVLEADPAAAHVGGGGTSPSNYRSTVSAIQPATDKMEVTVGVGGQWLRVSSRGAAEIVVSGYQDEPFLRLARGRVYVNPSSITAARTGQLPGPRRPEDGSTGPQWTPLADGDSVTWVDARPAGGSPPPGSAPGAVDSAGVGRWAVALTVDGKPVTVTGTRVRVEPPLPWSWLAVLGVLAAGVAVFGWTGGRRRMLAAVAAVAGATYLAHLVGAAAVPQPAGAWTVWFSTGLSAALGGTPAGFAAVTAWRRSESASFVVAMAGGVLAVLAGPDLAVFWNSQLAFAGPAWLERVLVALAVGSALGLVIAGVNLIRRGPVPRA